MDSIHIKELDQVYIKALQKKKICFVVFGQSTVAQAVLVNEILGKNVLPFEIKENSEKNDIQRESWRYIRIKV